jgi:hypothetical protein
MISTCEHGDRSEVDWKGKREGNGVTFVDFSGWLVQVVDGL